MLEIIKFDSFKKGKNLLILGAVHGNEICGTEAIYDVIKEIKSGKIAINNGSVTFIPICNPEAYKNGKRFIDINLNRLFKKIHKPQKYEEFISQKIIKYINECDYLLDIHSMPTDGPIFTFLDKNTKKIRDFTLIQNFENIMIGWNDVFGGKDNSSCGYGIRKDKVCATIECGNHYDPQCVNIAKKAILNSLSFLKIADIPLVLNDKKQKYIKMNEVFYKDKEGKLIKKWQHLDKVKKGEAIAKFDDGELITAKYDCLIILPHNDNVKLGNEWFYLGNFVKKP